MLKERDGTEGSGDGGDASQADGGSPAPLGRAELLVSVFVTGAVVMMIEILGTRIIGPVFGVSLFVWSALLAVTLGSLAIGYYGGGVLVDRTPNPRLLGWTVAAAGLLLGVVPVLRHTVLRAGEAWGPRGGPLLSATLLFAPCLVALGMIGPVAVKLTTTHLRSAGHGVGSVYAISTAGSLLGTLLTAFFLIPRFETDQVVLGGATLLALMGGASLAWRRRPVALLIGLVPLLASGTASTEALPPGFRLIDHSQSLYGLVEVIDDSNRNVRFLRADHSIIGAEFLRDHTTAFAFIHQLESIRFLRPEAKDVLQIGLGTGALPSALERRGLNVDVVEIDPAVVRFAGRYFGFATRGQIAVEDARTFLRRTDRRYDLIVHDTFTGGTTPEHLLSLEVVQDIRKLLRPGGVLALNFAGYVAGPKAEATWAVARTLLPVFATVRIFRDSAPEDDPDGAGNVIFFASDGALDFTVPTDARFENDGCERVLRAFQRWEILKPVPRGAPITDSHNPLARLQIPVAEDHFEAMNQLLPVAVWLH